VRRDLVRAPVDRRSVVEVQLETLIVLDGARARSRVARGVGPAPAAVGDGNDVIKGSPGPGPGNDTLGGGAADTISAARESTRSTTRRVKGGDGQPRRDPNDGEPGEATTWMPDVENITGGSGDDVLIGNDQSNVLNGGPGTTRSTAGSAPTR